MSYTKPSTSNIDIDIVKMILGLCVIHIKKWIFLFFFILSYDYFFQNFPITNNYQIYDIHITIG